MFNQELITAWADMRGKILRSPDAPAGLLLSFDRLATPLFEYDYDKCRLVLNMDQNFTSGALPPPSAIKATGLLWFNTRFYELLSDLPRVSRTGRQNYEFIPGKYHENGEA